MATKIAGAATLFIKPKVKYHPVGVAAKATIAATGVYGIGEYLSDAYDSATEYDPDGLGKLSYRQLSTRTLDIAAEAASQPGFDDLSAGSINKAAAFAGFTGFLAFGPIGGAVAALGSYFGGSRRRKAAKRAEKRRQEAIKQQKLDTLDTNQGLRVADSLRKYYRATGNLRDNKYANQTTNIAAIRNDSPYETGLVIGRNIPNPTSQTKENNNGR